MAKRSTWFFSFTIVVFLGVLGFQALAYTDQLDAMALRDLYRALNRPPQLEEWKPDGGDPCEESWRGVACSGSSVIHIDLHGLGLSGNLGYDLSNLQNLKQLDLSSNNIHDAIPYNLPLNVTHLNLASNNLSGSIPYSVNLMRKLRHLNVSHNALSGPLGDVFNGLDKIREMDLSFNNFTGDLPNSFGSLTNISKLFLQSNQLTGSVVLLSDLPLSDLNIEDNHFSGVIPEKFQNIRNLWIGGNRFDINVNYAPWKFPSDVLPNEQNITSPPTVESNAFLTDPSQEELKHKKRRVSAGGIVFMVGGIIVATCAVLYIVMRARRSQKDLPGSSESGTTSKDSLPVSSTVRDYSPTALEASPRVSSSKNSPPLINPWHLPPVHTVTMKASKRRSLSTKCKVPIGSKVYTMAELKLATNSFSQANLLGEGSLGSVFRAEFPDGKIFAVKNISTVQLSISEEEQVFSAIWTTSQLIHPNIVRLMGYCVEYGHHFLVYEYIRNLSLENALHCASYTPLSWGQRLHIALDVARAIDYLHSRVSPVAHSNLKAANILLDEALVPHVCDCGLSVLRPLTSNTSKVKASEMAIADSGYIAPEQVQAGMDGRKADIYAFGVLLLELLTARRPFDNSKENEEKSLVKWACSRLHDNESLAEMVDPAIKRKLPSKALSHFADIVSLCIQPEKEFRPPMSVIVDSLQSLLQRPGVLKGDAVDDRSFCSSSSRFFSSPTLSYYSI